MPISRSGGGYGPPARSTFPLGVSGRYIIDAQGAPFFIHGDTPWMIVNQLTDGQIETYLRTRSTQGVNAILIEAPGYYFTSQTPATDNVDGDDPFTVMSPVNWTLNNVFWLRVDHLVNRAKACGIFVLINPAYLGFNGDGVEGWMPDVTAASAGTLQAYGAALATRYTQGNVGWCFGGDFAGDTTQRDKQANILTGIRSVRTGDIVTGHAYRTDADAYTYWGAGGQNYAGFNLNNIYLAADGSDGYSEAETAYGRSGPLPFVMIEAGYEGSRTLAEFRRASWQSVLSGACGHFWGNNPIWGFGEPHFNGGAGAAASLASLTSTGATQMRYLRDLLVSYSWQSLVPRTGSTLVTTSLGTGTGRVCPASYTSGSTVALIYSPAVNVTLDMTHFAQGSVRVRLYDVTAGTFSAVGTFSNTGTQAVTVAAESVVVCD